jgi:nucleoid DNA-binding protein
MAVFSLFFGVFSRFAACFFDFSQLNLRHTDGRCIARQDPTATWFDRLHRTAARPVGVGRIAQYMPQTILIDSTLYKEGEVTMAKAAPAKKPLTKSQIIQNIAAKTELSKKDVQAVFQALTEEIQASVKKNGPGSFTIPGLVKIVRKHVPAKPAGERMSFGELKKFPAKPASTKIKVTPLKSLKEMV